jgi:3-methyladenine DNA glycosylase AlkD
MSRFGIQTGMALGVSNPQLRDLAKKVRTSHELAEKLWKTRIHEARILASMIDDPAKVSEDQMEKWAADFDSWDVVDGCCGNLFDRTEFAVKKSTRMVRKKRGIRQESWFCPDGRNGGSRQGWIRQNVS